MSLSSTIARANFALSQPSLSPEDRLEIIERTLASLDHFRATDAQAHARTQFLQLRASTLEQCDTRSDFEDDDAYDPDPYDSSMDDAAWDTASLYEGPIARSLAHLL